VEALRGERETKTLEKVQAKIKEHAAK